MSKKEAEDEARRAKEATGRALFEKGDWQDDSESEDEEDDDDDDSAGFDLAALRKETEALEDTDGAPVKVYES